MSEGEGAAAKPVAALRPQQRALLELRLKQKGRSAFSITARTRDERPRALSFSQERMWFLWRLDPTEAAYNTALLLRMRGPLDAEILGRALNEILKRHDVLRSRYPMVEGRPVQIADPWAARELEVVDLGGRDRALQENESARQVREWAMAPYNLETGPVVRMRLIRFSSEEHLLALGFHHIAFDAWSRQVFQGELQRLYSAFAEGKASPLAELPIQYADFSEWQRTQESQARFQESLAYWKRQLAGEIPVLDLPIGRRLHGGSGYAGAMVERRVTAEWTRRVEQFAAGEGATLFMALMAGLNALIHRYSGALDVTVGTPVAGRTHVETESLAGCFINTLAIRSAVEPGMTFRELLRQVRGNVMGALDHQATPFEKVVEAVSPARDLERAPLFQAMLNLRNVPTRGGTWGALEVQREDYEVLAAPFELSFDVEQRADGLRWCCVYASQVFEAEAVKRMLGHLEQLLSDALERPDARLGELNLLAEGERVQLLETFQPAREAHVDASYAHELFEFQVMRTPDAVAVVDAWEMVSYAELERRANRVAQRLMGLGIGPGRCVALGMNRSVGHVAGFLAVLKAGATVLPLDPTYPEERLGFMLEDSGAALVITHGAKAASWARSVPVLSLEALLAETEDGSVRSATQDESASNGDPAYLIYTSGSTGRPNGVVVSHAALVSQVQAASEAYEVTEADRILCYASFAFDASIELIFVAICTGAAVVIRGDDLPSTEELARWMGEKGVTVADLPPVVWSALAEVWKSGKGPGPGPGLRLVTVGGEEMPVGTLRVWRDGSACGVRVLNVYGPTEATVTATFFDATKAPRDLSEAQRIPIGRPLGHRLCYVLNEEKQLEPVGVPGELYIGGSLLAIGYLNRPELTAARFVADPFASTPGARMYRTGDCCVWREDGNLEFLGRRDSQVKLRGFRIELGEVEGALASFPAVEQAVAVLGKSPGGERHVLACVTVRAGTAVDAGKFRKHLLERLPEYMAPSRWVELERIPTLPNGKVDRRALEQMEGRPLVVERERRPPEGEVEEKLAAIWRELLGGAEAGRDDSFFGLGGHSLMAMRMVSLVAERLEVELPLRRVFELPELASLAAEIAALRGVRGEGDGSGKKPGAEGGRKFGEILKRGDGDWAPLTLNQEQLWFFERLFPGTTTYQIRDYWNLEGELDRGALERALGRLVERHEALRTRFEMCGGEVRQRVLGRETFRLAIDEWGGGEAGAEDRWADELQAQELARPFQIEAEALFRARWLRWGGGRSRLFFTFHHAIADGESLGIFHRELAALYRAELGLGGGEAASSPVQLGDVAVWQRSDEWRHGCEGELEYWRKVLAGAPEKVTFPGDFQRPVVSTLRGGHIEERFPEGTLAGLERVAAGVGSTVFMVLQAATQILLARHSGERDVVVGTPVSGRMGGGMEGGIGFYVNVAPVRVTVDGAESVTGFLRRVRLAALEAYEHQGVPFERMVQAMGSGRSASMNPIFQVLVAHERLQEAHLDLPGVRCERQAVVGTTSKFDASFFFREDGRTLSVLMEYSEDLYAAETAARIVGHLRNLVGSILAAGSGRVGDLSMLSAEEEHRVLREWNATVRVRPETTLDRLISEAASRTPDRVAVEFEGREWTYRELERRAGRLADFLRGRGVGPGVLVGVYLERSLEMVLALYGVLKAGGAYVPMDPEYPRDRVAFMLEDTAPGVLLTRGSLAGSLPEGSWSVVRLDEDWPSIEGAVSMGGERAGVGPGDLAYMIYTSGSTGRPKGALNTHRGVCNRLLWMKELFGVGEGDVVLQKTPFSFDVSVPEFFLPLLAGARLVFARPGGHRDPGYLAEIIQGRGVTLVHFVPSMLRAFLAAKESRRCVGLRHVMCSGEALAWELQEEFFRCLPADLHNLYGPTEAAVEVTYWKCRRSDSRRVVPIGRPIDNTQVYVLDEWGRPAPVGVAGELYLAGVQVGMGYHRRPELTAEKFVPDPYAKQAGARMYRTGDLCRWLPDGVVEYLGRLDHQVKVRGFRIELGEIEARLAEHPQVREAVVLAKAGVDGDSRLVAYLSARRAGEQVSAGELRTFLLEKLPEYMAPAAVVWLETLPLSPNGKVDRKQLPEPDWGGGPGREYVAPRNLEEERMAGVWKRVLGVERVGVNDSFFELGGHSLLALKLFAAIEEEFGRKLPMSALFQAPTLAGLAALLAGDGVSGRVDPLWSSLQKIREGGSRSPFFCVHGGGGQVLFARELLKWLDEELPFYGFQARGLDGVGKRDETVEEMAEHYWSEMRDVAGKEPVCLGGYCLGGLVAWEMAQRILASGGRVALLVMIDTYNPVKVAAWRATRTTSSIWREKLRFQWDNVKRLSMRDRLKFLAIRSKAMLDRRSRWVWSKISGEKPRVGERRGIDAVRNEEYSILVSRKYVPRAIDCPVLLYRPEQDFEGLTDPKMGWGELCGGGLEVESLPVSPGGLLVEPFIGHLGRSLNERIRRSWTEASASE